MHCSNGFWQRIPDQKLHVTVDTTWQIEIRLSNQTFAGKLRFCPGYCGSHVKTPHKCQIMTLSKKYSDKIFTTSHFVTVWTRGDKWPISAS